MYTLYRKPDNGPRQLVGYYDDVMEGAAAIEVDKEKFDNNAQYELERDDDCTTAYSADEEKSRMIEELVGCVGTVGDARD